MVGSFLDSRVVSKMHYCINVVMAVPKASTLLSITALLSWIQELVFLEWQKLQPASPLQITRCVAATRLLKLPKLPACEKKRLRMVFSMMILGVVWKGCISSYVADASC